MKKEEIEVTAPTSVVDQLKIKRAKLAKDLQSRLRKLDRQIELLEQSDAENILREAEKVLTED